MNEMAAHHHQNNNYNTVSAGIEIKDNNHNKHH